MPRTPDGRAGDPQMGVGAPGARPRLKDVAGRAGVSTALVSSYLNTPKLVGARSRTRIQKAIDELGFVPNSAARQLRSGVSRMIAFIAFDIGDPLFIEVARGAQLRASAAGLCLVLADTAGSRSTEREYLQLFEEQRVRGILLSPTGDPVEYLNSLALRRIPAVLIDQPAPSGRWSAVTVNDELGGELAAAHLLEIGRRRLAVVGGPRRISQVADRISGARKAVSRVPGASLEIINTKERTVAAGRAVGEAVASRALQARPDGVFCINDSLATGFIDAARTHALGIPKDLAVIGYNDTAEATAAGPLSSIRQPHRAFGATAVDLLIEEFSHSGDTDRRQVIFNPELVVRASTVS